MPVHLLLGVLRLRDATTLRLIDVEQLDIDAIKRRIDDLIQKGNTIYPTPKSVEDIGLQVSIPFSKSAVKVLSNAVDEFKKSGALKIEPKHILLALLRSNDRMVKRLIVS